MFHRIGREACLALAASIGFAGAAHADSIAGQGTWEMTLQARDLNGDGVADGYYDTVLDITWLPEGRAAAGTPYENAIHPGSGATTFANALAWAAALNVHGVTGWRLPRMRDTGAPGCQFAYSGTDCGYNVQTISDDGATVYGELAHLYYETLGNLGRLKSEDVFLGWVNDGPFVRIIQGPYWQTVINPPAGADAAWTFVAVVGLQVDWDLQQSSPLSVVWAIAVHDGDISASIPQVPEPTTALMMGLGLVALVVRAAREHGTRRG